MYHGWQIVNCSKKVNTVSRSGDEIVVWGKSIGLKSSNLYSNPPGVLSVLHNNPELPGSAGHPYLGLLDPE